MHSRLTSQRAMTLSEIMVVMTIFGFVIIGVLPFFIANLRSQYTGEQKLLINGDIRKVTNQMVENAREANSFVIYQAFTAQTRWDGATETRDSNGSGAVTAADQIADGAAGDFMVLVYYTDQFFDSRLYDGNPNNNPPLTSGVVTRLVCYWTAPNRLYPGENAIYTLDTDKYNTTGASTWTTSWGQTLPVTLTSTVTIESLLPPATTAEASAAEFPILLNNVSGLSSTGNPAVLTGYTFVNYKNKSIITRAKILHGNLAKRVTNTYNFTITPRG